LKLCGQEGLSETEMGRLLQLMAEKDVNINCCAKFTCNTPLMLICSSKSDHLIVLVKALLQREDVDLSLKNRLGHTALTLLIRQSQNASLIDCVRLLVNHGMDVAEKDIYNRCALHLLCQYYKGEDLINIARLLIHKDMDPKDLENCVEILRGSKLRTDAGHLHDLVHSFSQRYEAQVIQPSSHPNHPLSDPNQPIDHNEVPLPETQPVQQPLEDNTPIQDTVVLKISSSLIGFCHIY